MDDIFRIASQTKAIVSAAVLMLQEEGELLISTEEMKGEEYVDVLGLADEVPGAGGKS